MNIYCNAESVYTESKDGSKMYVEVGSINTSDADDIFDDIKQHVSPILMLVYLDETEIREYIKELDNG